MLCAPQLSFYVGQPQHQTLQADGETWAKDNDLATVVATRSLRYVSYRLLSRSTLLIALIHVVAKLYKIVSSR